MALSQTEAWKTKVHRFARRRLIGKDLLLTHSSQELRHSVRLAEQSSLLPQVLNRLTTQEFVCDPERQDCLERMVCILQNEGLLAPTDGLVLLGSALHGGSQLRTALNVPVNQKKNDIDVGFVGNNPDPNQLENIVLRINTLLKTRPYHLCEKFSPDQCFIPNLISLSHARNELITFARNPYPTFLLYFQPSFPVQVNERNRSLLLKALEHLWLNSPQNWQLVTQELLREWWYIHRIKEKHLINKDSVSSTTALSYPLTERDQKLIDAIQRESEFHMSQGFEKLLSSTCKDLPVAAVR